MARFPWLVWMSASMVWPLYLVAGIVVAVLAWRRRHASREGPALRPLVGVLLSPLTLSLWATVAFGAERGREPGRLGWASGVLTVLAVAAGGSAGLVLWRWRTRWLPATLCVVVALVGVALSWFVGAMAIADDWL